MIHATALLQHFAYVVFEKSEQHMWYKQLGTKKNCIILQNGSILMTTLLILTCLFLRDDTILDIDVSLPNMSNFRFKFPLIITLYCLSKIPKIKTTLRMFFIYGTLSIHFRNDFVKIAWMVSSMIYNKSLDTQFTTSSRHLTQHFLKHISIDQSVTVIIAVDERVTFCNN